VGHVITFVDFNRRFLLYCWGKPNLHHWHYCIFIYWKSICHFIILVLHHKPEIHDAVLLYDGGQLAPLVQGQHRAQGRVSHLEHHHTLVQSCGADPEDVF
jgi:hypothetical protein